MEQAPKEYGYIKHTIIETKEEDFIKTLENKYKYKITPAQKYVSYSIKIPKVENANDYKKDQRFMSFKKFFGYNNIEYDSDINLEIREIEEGYTYVMFYGLIDHEKILNENYKGKYYILTLEDLRKHWGTQITLETIIPKMKESL